MVDRAEPLMDSRQQALMDACYSRMPLTLMGTPGLAHDLSHDMHLCRGPSITWHGVLPGLKLRQQPALSTLFSDPARTPSGQDH